MTRVAQALRDADVDVPLRDLGVPARFHPHGTRAQILADLGLTAQDVARDVTGWVSGLNERSLAPVRLPLGNNGDRAQPARQN